MPSALKKSMQKYPFSPNSFSNNRFTKVFLFLGEKRRPRARWIQSWVTVILAAGASSAAFAANAFVAPHAYPAQRYEANWNRNLFYVPPPIVPEQRASFAENLAIGSYFGDKNQPTVVVVDKRTGE